MFEVKHALDVHPSASTVDFQQKQSRICVYMYLCETYMYMYVLCVYV